MVMHQQIAKVKEIIDRWGLKPGIMYDDYLDKPSEIYSRLEVQELRNKNHTGDRTENH